MAQSFVGRVTIREDVSGEITAPGGRATITIVLDGDSGNMELFTSAGQRRVHIETDKGNLWLGGHGADGDLVLFPQSASNTRNTGQATVHISGDEGLFLIKNTDGQERVRIEGAQGNLRIGGNGADGDLLLYPAAATLLGEVDPSTFHFDADNGNAWVGGNDSDGDLLLFRSNVTGGERRVDTAALHLDAEGGALNMRGAGNEERVSLSANSGNLFLGGNGADGDVVLYAAGTTGADRRPENAAIHLDADSGDIVLRNADCAEEFDVVLAEGVEPGAVLVIGDDGRLALSRNACDRRVAGIVAGAGDLRPGIVLGRQPGRNDRAPVALMGRVNCKVDACTAPVAVGDLLTTSDVPGHAMKAGDPVRAFGAVIGKALAPLEVGTGMIPVLVALQ